MIFHSAHPSILARFRSIKNPSSRSAAYQQVGFTLVELLMVIALVGILSAIGIPQLLGIYNNQSVINTANEVVSATKLAQNRALSNDQDVFSPIPTPQPDCTVNSNYVGSYTIKVESESSYRVFLNLRSKTKDNAIDCLSTPAQRFKDITVRQLPSNTYFFSGVGQEVTYETTSAQPTLSGGILNNSNPVIIKSRSTSLTYYICIDSARRVYAQTSACP